MNIEYRPITDEEFPAFHRAEGRGFLRHAREDETAFARERFEPQRSIAAFDGSEIVGTIGAYSFRMTVPGGADPPMAGVTDATVQATHRRRGIFTELNRRQLRDIHELGEPLAALWSSETLIYGRYGYGMAFQTEDWRIDRFHAAYQQPLSVAGRVAFVDAEKARKLAPAVWERIRSSTPGMTTRPESFWAERFRDPEHRRHGASAYFCAVYEQDGRVDGYVLYRVRDRWEDHFPAATLIVAELIAATDDAHAALWRLCFDVDLIATIEARNRPLDDPLPWRLADPRRLRRSLRDALWLRIVDVGDALRARRYASDGRIVLEVRDPFCPWNEGRYALEGGPDGAECTTTTAGPDITLSAADLAAVYMGAAAAATLARAGRIQARTEGALRTADGMFAWHAAPWCPMDF